MRELKIATAANIMVFMTDSADHVTGKDGLTLSIASSKDGAGFSTITPTVTPRSSGWYSLALTGAHIDTLGDLALHITAAGADPTDVLCRVVAYDPATAWATVGAAMGLVDNAISAAKIADGAISSAKAPNLDTQVSTRLAASGYTPPDNTGIGAINGRLPSDPADESLLEAAIVTRLAASAYTPPDNASITTIKGKTDNLPTDPASNTQVNTRAAPGAQMALTGAEEMAIADAVLTRDITSLQATAPKPSLVSVIIHTVSRVRRYLNKLQEFRLDGMTVHIEHDITIDETLKPITDIGVGH